MSEYMEIDYELDEDDPAVIHFFTNLPLSTEVEEYNDPSDLLEGSPVAQALAFIEGIEQLRMAGSDMTIIRSLDTSDYAIVADVSAALKDFFL